MDIDVREIHEGAVMEIRSVTAMPQVNFPPAFIADIQNDYRGTSPYHVNYCGYQQCRPGHRAGPFTRTSWLVHVVLNGCGVYKYRGREIEVRKGQAFLIYPDDTTTYIADREDPWEYGWVGFSGYRIPQILAQTGFTVEEPVRDVQDAKALMAIILRMMDAHRMTFSDELYRTSELLRFFGTLIRGQEGEHQLAHVYSGETYAQAALRYLNDNYMYRIKISDLASAIGVERSYLSRVFFAEYHQSPQQYLQRLRMEKARQMLEETPLTVAEIAAGSGYEDARSFTRMFRRKQGMSPSEYRATANKKTVGTK